MTDHSGILGPWRLLRGRRLGAVAINYGYYRFEDGIMWIAILFLVILVQAIQSLGMTLVKKVDRRAR